MEAGIPARLTAAEGRRFAVPVGGAFLALAGLFWWRGPFGASLVSATAGTLLVLAGLTIPARLGPVYRGWMKMALAISKVTTPIFMGIIFFGVITPIGWIARAVGHRPLTRAGSTVWVTREPGARASDLERQF